MLFVINNQQVFKKSPRKQKGVHKSKISQLFDDEDKLIKIFEEIDFINLIENYNLDYAITKFFNKLVLLF